MLIACRIDATNDGSPQRCDRARRRLKLGLCIGLYGTCWRGATGPRQAIGSGVSLVATDNTMSCRNIMTSYFESGARRWDDLAKVPYLSFATPKGPQQCSYISYDDEESLTSKGAWVKANGLGGGRSSDDAETA